MAMSPSEAYLIPPLLRPHILFTTTSPDTPPDASLLDYKYSARQAFLLPAPLSATPTTMPPTKHVHWSEDIPRTPSPASSTSSRQSSVGPYTPPENTRPLPHVAGHHTSRYGQFLAPPATPYPKTQPLPPSPSGSSSDGSPLPLVVNHLLSTSLHNHTQTRPFQWDLLNDPVRLATPSDPPVMEYLLQPAQLATPATSPPRVDVKIMHPHLPWVITVSASRYYDNDYATVGDVLQQLYQALRLSVLPYEYDAMALSTPGAVPHVQSAFDNRVQSAARRGVDERRKGIRRVDFLMGQTQFAGFTVVQRHGGELVLQLHTR